MKLLFIHRSPTGLSNFSQKHWLDIDYRSRISNRIENLSRVFGSPFESSGMRLKHRCYDRSKCFASQFKRLLDLSPNIKRRHISKSIQLFSRPHSFENVNVDLPKNQPGHIVTVAPCCALCSYISSRNLWNWIGSNFTNDFLSNNKS